MKISLYIHVPFCKSKCDYCDFYSVSLDTLENKDYIKIVLDNIIEEVKLKLEEIENPVIETVFIGGGTPSVINPDIFNRFLHRLLQASSGLLPENAEFTTEANVESCSKNFLAAASDGGVNRLSLGVQSFDVRTLEQIGRACFPEHIYESVLDIRSGWNGNFSVDLVSGVNSYYYQDVEKVLKISPNHLSIYQLTVEEDTPLFEKIESGEKAYPDEKLQADAIQKVNNMLSSAGYKRYEISNYARTGCECGHNLRYWNMQSYIGAGPAAVSSLYFSEKKTRVTNPADLGRYLSGTGRNTELLSDFDFLFEHFIMGCRLVNGIDDAVFFNRFGLLPGECIPQTSKRWSEAGLMNSETLKLNERGLLFLDTFLSEVHDELENKYKK